MNYALELVVLLQILILILEILVFISCYKLGVIAILIVKAKIIV